MAHKKPGQFSTEDQAALHHLSELLHLFQHRNKNQHRRSIWWRHFSIFRSQLGGLVDEIHRLTETPKSHLERTRKKAVDKELQKDISLRLDFWQAVLVPKWQNAFSQTIADGRFAALGLVLTAVLAQTCQLTGITANLEDLGQEEVEKVLLEFGRKQWGGGSNGEDHGQKDDQEDLGEAVARGGLLDDVDVADENVQEAKKVLPTKLPVKEPTAIGKPPRKKRKKENAIDDLFSGLD